MIEPATILFYVSAAFAVTLMVAGLFATLLGLITIVHFVRAKRKPMDESNRINHVRLWWFALTRPELFVSDQFDWLKNGEHKNITR